MLLMTCKKRQANKKKLRKESIRKTEIESLKDADSSGNGV
jgi:hypothetical protein